MSWLEYVGLLVTVVLAAVGGCAWMFTQLREQDAKLAALKEEQAVLRTTFAGHEKTTERIVDELRRQLERRIHHE